MRKEIVFTLLTLLLIPSILAVDLTVEKVSSGEVMIEGINNPAVFDLKITNNGGGAEIEFYNLVGLKIYPSGTTKIAAFETKDIELTVSPLGEFNYLGPFTFKYYIRDALSDTEVVESLTFRRIKLAEAFEIGAKDFDPDSSSVELYIRNKENFDFKNLNVKLSSPFFDVDETLDLGPKEQKLISARLNKEDYKELLAGFYTLSAQVVANDVKASFEVPLKFVEKDIVKTESKNYGFLINTKSIKKANEGNVQVPTEITINKNIISRLFTTFNPQPDTVERKGFTVTYTWSKVLNPGESIEVGVKTNWTFPFIIAILIIIVVAIAKQYSKTPLLIKKSITFVKAKGGEFALKVTINVNAKQFIERITLVDRIPQLVKIYEGYGHKPTKIDEKLRKIEWNFAKLEAGEVRTMSYIIYSKVGVFGKFALPPTRASYEKDGHLHESESNTAFFVTEQKGQDFEG